MGMDELQELEDDFDHTMEDQAEIEEKVQDELEEMLDDSTKSEVREEIIELDDDEFQDRVEYILDQL